MRQGADWDSQDLGSNSHWPYQLVMCGSGHSFLIYKMRRKEQCCSNMITSSHVKGSENFNAPQPWERWYDLLYPVCMVTTLGDTRKGCGHVPKEVGTEMGSLWAACLQSWAS